MFKHSLFNNMKNNKKNNVVLRNCAIIVKVFNCFYSVFNCFSYEKDIPLLVLIQYPN